MAACLCVKFYLVYIHPLQKDKARWHFLRAIVVDKQSVISQNIVARSEGACLAPNFEQLSLHLNL